jgi:MFS family permease
MYWAAIGPLTPQYIEDFSLSKVQAGAVVAAPTLATLVLSVPIGRLGDRLGARSLTIVGSVLLAATAFGQLAVADFWSLISVWMTFGLALALIATASVAWLSDSTSPRRRAAAVSGTTTAGGLGVMVGPAFAGILADHFGSNMPFAVLGVLSAAVVIGLLLGGDGPHMSHDAQPLRAVLRLVRPDRPVLGGVALMFLTGLQGGAILLLLSVQLDKNGLSAGDIGTALSVSLVLFVLASAFVTWRGERAAKLRSGGLAALFLGLSLLVPATTTETAWLVAFLFFRAPLWGVLSTLPYPVAVLGAHRAGIGRGTVIGLLNGAWGAGAVLGPLVGGFVAQNASQRAVYAVLALCSLAVAIWLVSITDARRCPRCQETSAP